MVSVFSRKEERNSDFIAIEDINRRREEIVLSPFIEINRIDVSGTTCELCRTLFLTVHQKGRIITQFWIRLRVDTCRTVVRSRVADRTIRMHRPTTVKPQELFQMRGPNRAEERRNSES